MYDFIYDISLLNCIILCFRGEFSFLSKVKHKEDDDTWKTAHFVQTKFIKYLAENEYRPPTKIYKGVDADRKADILAKLLPIIPEANKTFWEDL